LVNTKLYLSARLKALDIAEGREHSIGENTYRAIQGLPLLKPAGTKGQSWLQLFCLMSGPQLLLAAAVLIYWFQTT
jgi:hypothetical protein